MDCDEFAAPSPPQAADAVPINIESVGEIVSSTEEVQKTLSSTEQAARNEMFYGDLPESERPGREEQEQHWMAPKPGQEFTHLYSGSLSNPEDCIVLGSNKTHAFVLRCATQEQQQQTLADILKKHVTKTKKTKNELAEAMEAAFEEYAKKNQAFNHKLALATLLERDAFYRAGRFVLTEVYTKQEAADLLSFFTGISNLDPMLREPVSKLGPFFTSKLKALPTTTKASHRKPKMADRPGKRHATVEHAQFQFIEPPPAAETSLKTTVFSLFACKVPDKATTKQPKWKDAKCSVSVVGLTVPMVAFNDTHLAILYQPSDARVVVDVFAISTPGGNILLQLVAKRCFRFPPGFADQGFLNAHLSPEGIFSVAFANGVVAFDTSREEEEAHMLLLDCENKRKAMCAPIYGGGKLMLIGSDAGECYGVDWKTGKLLFIHQVPAVEPVFHAIFSNRRVLMHTVAAVAGVFSAQPVLEILPIDRPVAADMCGSLIFVLTKYGTVKVFSTHTRAVLHDFPAPKQAMVPQSPLLQPVYAAGIRAYPDRVVCTFQNGSVQTIKLSFSTMTPPPPK